MKIPGKLLADCANVQGLRLIRELLRGDAFTPQRQCESEQQYRFNQHDTELKVGGRFAFYAMIVRAGIPPLMKPHQRVEKKNRPPEKKQDHEPMAKLEHVIDEISMFRSVRHEAHPTIEHKLL